MKKRIVSMILALSMVLSILPVSAFADAGTSAAAAETTAAGTNEETTNSVVTIKIGADGRPEEQSGTGWSYDSSNNWLAIAGVANAKTEYILDGYASCNVAISTSSYEVYLLNGVVKGQLWIDNPNACVLGGSYAEAVLENGTIDGGTYGKLTEKGGSVKGGYFKDISGLQSATQQQAHKLILPPEDCTLNGQPVTGDVYMLKRYSDHSLKLEVQYAPGCVAWAAAIGGTSPACRYQQRLLERLWHDFHQWRRYNDLCRGQYVPAAFREQRTHSTDSDSVHGQGTEFYR